MVKSPRFILHVRKNMGRININWGNKVITTYSPWRRIESFKTKKEAIEAMEKQEDELGICQFRVMHQEKEIACRNKTPAKKVRRRNASYTNA